jgi:hypothetical protein
MPEWRDEPSQLLLSLTKTPKLTPVTLRGNEECDIGRLFVQTCNELESESFGEWEDS